MDQEIKQEFRVLSRESVLTKVLSGTLTTSQGAQLLDLSPRQLRRLKKRFRDRGRDGLVDRRAGAPRKKRIDHEKAEFLCQLKRGKYKDFSVSHFYDIATDKHGLKASYSWLLRMLQNRGVVEKAKRKGTYRRRRPRQPMRGMRLHTDGSTHHWFGRDRPMCDLVIMLDDADGKLLAARFVKQEGTLSTLQLLEDVLTKHGRFGELYHDRGSAYVTTKDKAVGPDRELRGQVSRVLKALGIKQIWAYSPQARGRCERAFGTIQGRLVAELADEGIRDLEMANAYLQDVFVPAFNKRFTVEPQEKESAFTPLALRRDALRLLLSIHVERTVRKDYTLSYEGNTLQLPAPKDGRVLAKQKVTLHRFPDEGLAVSHHGKVLAYFQSDVTWERFKEPGTVHLAKDKPKASPPLRYKGRFPAIDDLSPKTGVLRRPDLFHPSW